MQSTIIINTWHIEAMVSTTSVTESALNTSFGAGTESQIKLGIIIIKNNSSPQTSKLNLYFFSLKTTPLLLNIASCQATRRSTGECCSGGKLQYFQSLYHIVTAKANVSFLSAKSKAEIKSIPSCSV